MSITNATSYQDSSFTRPITAKTRQDVTIDEVEVFGGFAAITVTVVHHFDNGVFCVDDIELFEVEIWRGDDCFYFDDQMIANWKQHRISEIVSLVEDKATDEVLGL